jgi:DTW domain-containing protein YfiP
MHASLCVCALMPTLETRTRLILVIHRAEDRKPTNTGRLALLSMPNSSVMIRGREDAREDAISFPEGTRPLFLFPHEDATPLDRAAHSPGDDRPVTLVVPDGNWRQASKVRNRLAGLESVPCVSLPIGAPSTYRLRSEAHPFGLATIEAIARALRLLEGSVDGPRVEAALLHVFQTMVERTLWSRGEFETEHVTGGIPEGAERHNPARPYR